MAQSISYKEGESIRFKINKHIELSENENYYVLKDEFGRKQLLKSDFYENYNFKIGQDIICRVDHINCSGKIFLEPEHPFYKEGKIYDFKINKAEITKDRTGKGVVSIKFIDNIGNVATCTLGSADFQEYTVGRHLSCKVERIKKGKLYLSLVNQKSQVDFNKGEYYKFKISDIKTLKDNIKYYILTDEQNNINLLKCEFYRHHNLKKGQIIECTIIKYSSKGYYILEPKHPYYEIGKTYEFEFVKEEKDAKSKITGDYDITVKDIFGEYVKFMSEKSLLIDGINPKSLKCKVSGVKKGKPLLNAETSERL
ncbi:MAG: hypothetical protein L3J35_03310 [Bacteroidales bacterium]|nr:hypothetical protein [Bacteroidales bacterium]